MSGYLDLAIIIAERIHRDQVDKAGRPYIEHPKRVMSAVEGDLEKQVAILHDVLEDSDLRIKELEIYGFDLNVTKALDALTKRTGENYFDYIRRVRLNPIATRVKLADLADNMDLTRLPEVTEKDLKRQAKYVTAKRMLEE